MARTLFLDTFALFEIAKSPERVTAVQHYVRSRDFIVVTSSQIMAEAYPNQQRWNDIAGFLASLPFCIAEVVDKLAEREAKAYPETTALHMEFCSADITFSQEELKDAILLNLQGKVAGFHKPLRAMAQKMYDALKEAQRTFMPPEENGRYSRSQRERFLQIGVLQALPPEYLGKWQAILARDEAIDIVRFKSVYLQQLAIWLEYYEQRKPGKLSDIGDFVQLGYLPYLDEAILDKERVNLVGRINRLKVLAHELKARSLAEFLRDVGVS